MAESPTKLRQLREQAGFKSAAVFAKQHDIPESTYRSAENGTRPLTVRQAKVVGPKLGVAWRSLLPADDDDLPESAPRAIAPSSDGVVEVGGTEFAKIPVYEIRFAAGAGSSNDDETPIDHYLVSLGLLRSMTDAAVSQIAIFQADGDSMESTIFSRDWVFVDRRKNRLTTPGIYALVFEGDGLLKRAAQHLETGAVTLISDNSKYPPQTIRKPDRLQVVGRVFMSLRRH